MQSVYAGAGQASGAQFGARLAGAPGSRRLVLAWLLLVSLVFSGQVSTSGLAPGAGASYGLGCRPRLVPCISGGV